MRRIMMIAVATLFATLILVACGTADDNNQGEEQTNTNDVENIDDTENQDSTDESDTDSATNNDQSNMEQQMEELDYKEFELEVEYSNDNEYEAKLDYDDDRFEAKLEDDLKNIELKDQEAFDEIFPRVESLTIDQETAKEDAIKQTLDAFDLDTDYKKFELEITFNDGTKIEFKDKK